MPRWLRVFVFVLLAAGGCGWLAARLGGTAPPVWPPVGVALAAVLVVGRSAALPAGLGAGVALLGRLPVNLDAVGWAAGYGLTVAVQAMVAGWAVRRLCDTPLTLATVRDAAVFLLIAGPAQILVSPILLAAALGIGGWAVWLAGVSGGITFAVLGLTVAGRPAALWRARRTTVGVPVLGAVGLAFLAGPEWAAAAAMLAGVLLAVTGRADRDRAETAARAAELAAALHARELTAAALRASESRLAEAQRLARVGYWEWDPVTGEAYWTPEVADVLGLPGGDHEPTVAEFVARLHPDDRPGFEQAVRDVLLTRRPADLELRITRPDDGERWAAVRLAVVDGPPIGLLGTLQDVTARKTAELAARSAADRLAEAQRVAAVGSFDWVPGRPAADWSDQMYRLLGHAPGSVPTTHDTFLDAVHPDDRPLIADRMTAALDHGEPYEFDFRIVRPDGEVRHLHVDGVLDRDAGGRVRRFHGTNTDITDRVRAEDERRQFDRRLEQAQRLESLGVLAGGVAHDFNNLMTGVMGNAGLLRELLPADSEFRDFLTPIEKAAAHAASLCQQMLAVAGKGMTVRGPVDLHRLVADTADLVRLAAGGLAVGRAEVGYTPPAGGLPLIEADESQVRQVLLNLVSNAAEALGPDGGRIELRTGWGPANGCPEGGPGHTCGGLRPGRYAWLEVRDTGAGMSAETMARVFDPFFSTKSVGRGLGLSAVHGIARGHGGGVCVGSQPGVGTAIRVHFLALDDDPLVRTPAPAARRTQPSIPTPAARIPAGKADEG